MARFRSVLADHDIGPAGAHQFVAREDAPLGAHEGQQHEHDPRLEKRLAAIVVNDAARRRIDGEGAPSREGLARAPD